MWCSYWLAAVTLQVPLRKGDGRMKHACCKHLCTYSVCEQNSCSTTQAEPGVSRQCPTLLDLPLKGRASHQRKRAWLGQSSRWRGEVSRGVDE